MLTIEWNANFAEGDVFHRFGDVEMYYRLYNPSGIVRKRDFITVRRKIYREDGSVLIIERSTVDDRAPVKTKAIRGNIFFQFRCIYPADESGYVTLISANQTDVGV